jgi:hypothetical protein
VHGAKASIGGRLHREQCNDLEQMVLNDVAQTTSRFCVFRRS